MATHQISFATIATFGLGAFVALAIGVTLYMSGIAGVRSTQDLVAERAEVLLNSLERRINSRLKPVDEQAEWIAHLIAEGWVRLDETERLDGIMLGALGSTPQVRNLTIVSPEGKARRWRRSERTAITEDWSDRPNIKELIERGRTQTDQRWLPPLRSMTSRRAVLVHVTPLHADGRFVGILSQIVPLFRLSSDMAVIGRELDATPFILYGTNRVLAHPWLAADEVLSLDHPLLAINEVGDPILARIYSPDDNAPFGMRALWGANAATVQVNDIKYIFLYRELSRFHPDKLTIGAYIDIDQSDIGAPMQRIMASVAAGLGVLVIAVLFAAFAGRWLSRPVQVLARAAGSAHEGKLDEVPHLRGSSVKEFDDAARAFNAMVDGLRERALIRDTLGAFVPQEVARKLLAGKGELEAVEADATILICDIEAFTAHTDSLGPRRLVEFLNAYFEAMAQIIARYGGVITQFQGDAVLASFNVPIPDREHAANALSAAIEMIEATDTRDLAGVRVRNRIGISTGHVLAGAVGSRGQKTYTVHGNTVNLASRIEELNKEYATRILISNKTAERCPQFRLRKVAEVSIRGYSDVLTLHTPETGVTHLARAAAGGS
jgi:class 3 adenylate cyclase